MPTICSSRRQSGAACKVKEFLGYVSNAETGEDVIVEIAVQRFIAAVGTVVVVVLATEIECRGRHVVIEEPACDAGRPISCDQERPVFIQRVTALWVEPEKAVQHRHAQPTAVQIEFAGLIAEAVEAGRHPFARKHDGCQIFQKAVACAARLAREDLAVRQRPGESEWRERDRQGSLTSSL